MSTLVLDQKEIQVMKKGAALLIVQPNDRPVTFPLRMLTRVVVLADISFNSALILELSRNKIPVIFIHPRRPSDYVLAAGSWNGNTERRIAQYRVTQNHRIRLYFAKILVRQKIFSQERTLRRILSQRPDKRFNLLKGLRGLRSARNNVKGLQVSADEKADILGALRGYEGSAARIYFESLSVVFPPSLGFKSRQKNPPPDPVNSVLSLSYTILASRIECACLQAGLDVGLAVLHDVSYGRASLVWDLLEIYRGDVDYWVWNLFRSRRLRAGMFTNTDDRVLLGELGRKTYYPALEEFLGQLKRPIEKVVSSLVSEIAGESYSTIKPDDMNSLAPNSVVELDRNGRESGESTCHRAPKY